MDAIRVLLADDHQLVRAGIRALLEKLKGVQVVGDVGDGREAVRMAKELSPDVVLMDIAMPGLNGLEAVERIKKENPAIHVIMLSVFTDQEFVAQALRFGSSGYLLKASLPSELEVALKAVRRGESYLSPVVSKQIVSQYLERVGVGSSLFELLTSRQREILQLIGEGRTTKEIAQILEISAKTVERHRAELMDRLDIHDVAGLVRYAVRMKLINPNEESLP